MRISARTVGIVLLLSSCAAACHGTSQSPDHDDVIGFNSSLPILWGESDDFRDMLDVRRKAHWAAEALADHGRIVPLDTLADGSGRVPLSNGGLLVMAQPRALSPQENVALDSWVRGGGRLLLFADPFLTQHSRYALGDPRRPSGMAMLSPILAHWGLELQFDADQPASQHSVTIDGVSLPVELPGRFRLLGIYGDERSGVMAGNGVPSSVPAGKVGDAPAPCVLDTSRILADCRVGRGRVLAIADAHLFDDEHGQDATERRNALVSLISRLKNGD